MKYFVGEEEKSKVKIGNLRKFHIFVKAYLYGLATKNMNNISLLELAAGRGPDIFYRYIKNNVKYVLAIDLDKDALEKFKNRYNKKFKKKINIDFEIANISKNITDIIGKYNTKFDVVSIQFAFHYFLSNKNSLNNIFLNIDTYLKKGGYFIFTTFDGIKVFELLKKKKYANKITVEKEGKDILQIKKLYINDIIKNYGQRIDVCIQTIGCHIEYLVNYNFIIDYFEDRNYKLIETNSFSHLLKDFHQETGIILSEQEKLFSLLNRYTILQKK